MGVPVKERGSGPRKCFVLVLSALVVVLTLLHWSVLVFRLPWLTSLESWFYWRNIDKPFASIVGLGTGAALFTLALGFILRSPGQRPMFRVMALVVLGFALQHGLARLEGRGLDGMRDRIVCTGHAEFASAAVQQPSVLNVLRDYEVLASRGDLGAFAPSKPPGVLLFYMATDRLAQAIHPQTTPAARLENLRTFAAWLWPLLSCLVLFPLFFFARRAFGPERAVYACAFYLVVPSVQLITLQTDQVLFPFLATTAAWLALAAIQEGSVGVAAAAGAATFVAMYCSFPLGAAAAVGAVTGAGLGTGERSGRWHSALRFASGFTAGLLAVGCVFAVALNLDFFARYERAVAYHTAWKHWTSGTSITYFALLNTLEFVTWLGIPLAALTAWQSALGLGGIFRRRFNADSALSVALVGLYLALALAGKTKGEVARLWLFVVPFACASAVAGIVPGTANDRSKRCLAATIMLLQAGTLLVVKRYQDFR